MEKEENQNNPSANQNEGVAKETEKLEENLAKENKQEIEQEPKKEIQAKKAYR